MHPILSHKRQPLTGPVRGMHLLDMYNREVTACRYLLLPAKSMDLYNGNGLLSVTV